MRKLVFVEAATPVDVVHHPQPWPRQARRVQHPIQKGARIFSDSEPNHRLHRQFGITKPAVPVILISLASDRLWQ
jgi:hypothetical protein